MRLKNEYDRNFSEFRARLLEQQQQQLPNTSSHSLNLDQSIGEQVREQVRIAEEFDRLEDEQCRRMLSEQLSTTGELKRLVDKLHTEGKSHIYKYYIKRKKKFTLEISIRILKNFVLN